MTLSKQLSIELSIQDDMLSEMESLIVLIKKEIRELYLQGKATDENGVYIYQKMLKA